MPFLGTERYGAPEFGEQIGLGTATAGAASTDLFVVQNQGSKAADVWFVVCLIELFSKYFFCNYEGCL
jgi:hypothetical protein